MSSFLALALTLFLTLLLPVTSNANPTSSSPLRGGSTSFRSNYQSEYQLPSDLDSDNDNVEANTHNFAADSEDEDVIDPSSNIEWSTQQRKESEESRFYSNDIFSDNDEFDTEEYDAENEDEDELPPSSSATSRTSHSHGPGRGSIPNPYPISSSSSEVDDYVESSTSPTASPPASMQYMITSKMKEILQKDLLYTPNEISSMKPEVASIVIERKMQRPHNGMPIPWSKNFNPNSPPSLLARLKQTLTKSCSPKVKRVAAIAVAGYISKLALGSSSFSSSTSTSPVSPIYRSTKSLLGGWGRKVSNLAMVSTMVGSRTNSLLLHGAARAIQTYEEEDEEGGGERVDESVGVNKGGRGVSIGGRGESGMGSWVDSEDTWIDKVVCWAATKLGWFFF